MTTSQGEMFTVARSMSAALRESSLTCEGINFFDADGDAAFQEVFQPHLHVFPCYAGDGFAISARWASDPDDPS
ncbi:hypothetical protein GCM10023169_29200 [Georgenia halophila]|uniref:HIT domain-containing protein n=1 Tax=Georgenia halophila TaxID=620889 RepID=A0ABP8LG50_9MICO